MPTLELRLTGVPTHWPDGRTVVGEVTTTKGVIRAEGEAPDLLFQVPFEVRDGKPSGPAVRRENDGRRFVYVQWLAVGPEGTERPRRLKVHFEAETRNRRIHAVDAKGLPLCASAPREDAP